MQVKLTFLEAPRPLVKSYSLDPEGKLQKESYPRVSDFTSHDVVVSSPTEFRDALIWAAGAGWCLLKGNVARPLKVESRAGSTDANAPTYWACLDFDQLAKGKTIDAALRDAGLKDVSYVLQYSASQGIEPGRGDTGHVFLMFTAPVFPTALKQWLIGLNLRLEALVSQLGLTKTNNALSWPLDVSTCQNDKLLYLAPPELGAGITPWEGERIQLVVRQRDYLDPSELIVPTVAENRAKTNDMLNELREAAGLPARKWTMKGEILVKPDQSTITGVKDERGYRYFNFNGGDSWGYWHPMADPSVIRNFKGEPFYNTEELLPEYWAQLQADKRTAQDDAAAPLVLTFRDFKSATYYNGLWTPLTGTLELARAASELQLQHYRAQHGLAKLDSVPIWNLIYDPHSDVRVDVASKTINQFQPSIYMRTVYPTQSTLDNCPTIRRLIENAVARDPATFGHLVNWIAAIFQYRERTQTAWAWHGTQGTGKGLLVYKVLVPLFGSSNVAVRRMEDLEDKFNGHLETSLLVVIDEAEIDESRKSTMIMASIKNQITEPEISIRRMFAASYNARNHCSWVFTSNRNPVVIEASDRRFNVGEFRREKFVATDAEIQGIEAELPYFAAYLQSFVASAELARTVLVTEDRAEMIATSTTSVDTISEALLRGDLEYFWESMPSGFAGITGTDQNLVYDAYTKILHMALIAEDGVHKLTREEVAVLYRYNTDNIPRTPAKLTALLRHHGVVLRPVDHAGKTVRGLRVQWVATESWRRERLAELQNAQPVLHAVAN